MFSKFGLAAGAAVLVSAVSVAAETVTYTYDAKGRLVTVTRAGPAIGTKTSTYQHDRADNRKRATIAGGGSRVVVVPLGGLRIIPIP